MKLLCPACGGEVAFKSKWSVFGVCPYCASMLVRRDLDVENLGKQSAMPADFSPLQLGTRGRIESASFELVGRLKIGWVDGNWNEWYAAFDDGRDGWISDAEGLFTLSFQKRDVSRTPGVSDFKAGDQITLLGKTFEVSDIKQVTCLATEGELPFASRAGRKSTSIDLHGSDDTFCTLDFGDDEKSEPPIIYLGTSREFEDFQFNHLREFDGW